MFRLAGPFCALLTFSISAAEIEDLQADLRAKQEAYEQAKSNLAQVQKEVQSSDAAFARYRSDRQSEITRNIANLENEIRTVQQDPCLLGTCEYLRTKKGDANAHNRNVDRLLANIKAKRQTINELKMESIRLGGSNPATAENIRKVAAASKQSQEALSNAGKAKGALDRELARKSLAEQQRKQQEAFQQIVSAINSKGPGETPADKNMQANEPRVATDGVPNERNGLGSSERTADGAPALPEQPRRAPDGFQQEGSALSGPSAELPKVDGDGFLQEGPALLGPSPGLPKVDSDGFLVEYKTVGERDAAEKEQRQADEAFRQLKLREQRLRDDTEARYNRAVELYKEYYKDGIVTGGDDPRREPTMESAIKKFVELQAELATKTANEINAVREGQGARKVDPARKMDPAFRRPEDIRQLDEQNGTDHFSGKAGAIGDLFEQK